jgi:hypothetical protein
MSIQLILDSHSEATQVLEAAEQLIKKFDYLTVNDLYELVGQVGRHDYHKLGWTDLASVTTERTVDGLSTALTFPSPTQLNL